MSKKRKYLLIDGYNIIYGWDKLKHIADKSLEDARLALVEQMSEYRAMTNQEIIIVFDAHKVKGNVGEVEQRGGVQIVYTREAETADHYIERAASDLTKRYSVRVATSDNLEQVIILSRGADRVSARDFAREVEQVKQQIEEIRLGLKPVKRNMLMDNLDCETAAMLERMRRNEGDGK
ncbi:MAG: NYN domain-containing protein [Clostridiales bacterium]|nr:NYN domain-containing protein [Clostridiales bacterium]